MVILGLTGSIGMGKSTAAGMLRRMGLAVYDSDASVRLMQAPGGSAIGPIAASFPDVVKDGVLDREKLGALVFGDIEALKTLEIIMHPLVHTARRTFLEQSSRARRPMVVLDVPLLYEIRGDRMCDAVIVVTAPQFLQRQRVLSRPGMTPEKFAGILTKQIPDAEKRRRADYVVQTGIGHRFTYERLHRIVDEMRQRPGTGWPPAQDRLEFAHA